MRRIGGLLERIVDRSNLGLAFWKAAKGRRGTHAVRAFSQDLDARLTSLAAGIRDGTVPVGDYSRFVVFDPKQRTIHAAPFPQRVLHHALMNVCGPVFERGAIGDSCACRTGKGNAAALRRAVRFAGAREFFLKMDVRRYFDSIDHAILKRRYRRLFRERNLVELFDRIVDSYRSDPAVPGRGLPIGTLTSQYLANFYLDTLDRFVKEELRCRCYVRFMDDFALWEDRPSQLAEWRDRIVGFLRAELRLEVKVGTRLLPTAWGMPFLGFRVMPGGLLLGRRARRRFVSRVEACEAMFARGQIDEAELQRRVGSLVAHTDQARCRAWRRRVLATHAEYDETRGDCG